MTADLGDRRRFFISHSSQQKSFALELSQKLQGDAWVDLHEIDIGDVLLEEISEGISSASDFVLLWSREAADSVWVGYEIHMAFIRYLEDNAINLRVVTLDDTPVPLYLRPLLQAREALTPENAAALLLGAPPASRTLRTFVNRSDEIAALESTLYSNQKGFIWFFGLAGIGKRSLAREGLRRLLADRDRALRVTVRAGTGFVELHLKLCEALGIATPRAPMAEREARQAAVNLLVDYSSSGGVWLFEEIQHWLDEEAKPKHQLSIVLEALNAVGVREAERGAVFTSTRRPTLTGATAEASEFRRVAGLSSAFAVALLRGAGAEGDDDAIKRASSQLDGHPLALEMAVPDLAESTADWEERRLVTARTVLGELRLTESAEGLLEALAALDGPLPGAEIAAHLGFDSGAFQAAVAEAASYSLVEERESYLYAHPLVRDFYLRVFRRRDDHRERFSDLARRSRAFFDTAEKRDGARVDSLLTTFRLLSSSGRLEDALALHSGLFGTMLESGIELFHGRKHKAALQYFEAVAESTEESQDALTYAARSLAYLGRGDEARKLMDELLAEAPEDAFLLKIRARVEYILREWARSLDFLELARQIQPNSVAILRDIGQTQIRLGNWSDARVALERAIQVREPAAWVNYYYSQVLEHDGDLAEARTVIEEALRADPEVPMFRHRLGRIALRQGDDETAERQFRRALSLDPASHEAAVSLASLLIARGASGEARALVGKVSEMPGVRPALLATIEAKAALADGDLKAARRSVDRALAAEREPESLMLFARIQIAAFVAKPENPNLIRASVAATLDELRGLNAFSEADQLSHELRDAGL